MSGHDGELDRQTLESGLPVVIRTAEVGACDDLDSPTSRNGRIDEILLRANAQMQDRTNGNGE
ncbi:MAG: hypothetical protein K9M03_01500 [Kiritimatiellales bacterium]|nr:hypothetical protein [Kiritimatiellales bacterium]